MVNMVFQARKNNWMERPDTELASDYKKLKQFPRALLSDATLNYMWFREIVTKQQIDMYKTVKKNSDIQRIITFRNIIELLNGKFLYYHYKL